MKEDMAGIVSLSLFKQEIVANRGGVRSDRKGIKFLRDKG